jgi:hypothetical protein
MSNKIRLFCILNGDSIPFSVELERNVTVDDLKKAIKNENISELEGIHSSKLVLWHVSILSVPKRQIELSNLTIQEKLKKLDPTSEISEVFGNSPPKKTIHVIVERPSLSVSGITSHSIFFLLLIY